MASYETFGVERVQSRAGVWFHVRVPRELEVALKPPLRENVSVVLSKQNEGIVLGENHWFHKVFVEFNVLGANEIWTESTL